MRSRKLWPKFWLNRSSLKDDRRHGIHTIVDMEAMHVHHVRQCHGPQKEFSDGHSCHTRKALAFHNEAVDVQDMYSLVVVVDSHGVWFLSPSRAVASFPLHYASVVDVMCHLACGYSNMCFVFRLCILSRIFVG